MTTPSRFSFSSLPVLVAAAALFCPAPAAVADEADFQSLFNGKDLTDWEGLEGAWEVRDGAIRCTGRKDGKKNWLIWRGGQPGDFELRLEFRFTSGNSGVQVRSLELEEEDKPFHVRGYQVEIAEAEKMGLWHHSLAPEKYRSHLATAGQVARFSPDGEKEAEQVTPPEEIQKHCVDGEWNQLVVIAKGPKLIQKINGVVFAELTDEDKKHSTREGWVALQDHGKGTVAEFRNIRIRVD